MIELDEPNCECAAPGSSICTIHGRRATPQTNPSFSEEARATLVNYLPYHKIDEILPALSDLHARLVEAARIGELERIPRYKVDNQFRSLYIETGKVYYDERTAQLTTKEDKTNE